MSNEIKKLYRDTKNAQIAGVCAGIADYAKVDVTIIRLLMVAFALAGGAGIFFYLIGMIVIPPMPDTPVDHQQNS